ncbi:MAG: T9SS type A sorting domain-containing protein [Ignavibacteriales bacterium]|nr:T9SS type A sorting domain-containing protein [Ignavibacteriales bacterium]
MKHVTFFVALVLLTVAVTSLGFAGKASVQTTTAPTVSQVGTRSFTDSDLPADRAIKSSRQIDISTQVTSPRPIIANAGSTTLTTGLAGTYTIPGDFANLSSAVAILNYLGVSGDVVFELGSASYTEMGPITFGNFPGAGTYNVKVQPAAGVAVTFNFVSTLTEGKGFAFNGAKNITIDGLNTGGASLTLQYASISAFPTSDAFGATIYITNVSEYLAFKNIHVKGQIDNAVWADQTDGRPAIFVWSPDADGDGSKHLTFDGCTITNATYGMKVLGDYWSIDNNADYLDITNCKIGGAYGEKVNIGFFVEATKNVNFLNNIIDGVEYMQTYWYNGPTEWDYDGGVFYAGGTRSFMYDFGQATGAHFLIVDGGVFVNNVYRNIGYNGVFGDGVISYGTRIYSYNFGLAKTAYVENNRIYNITNPGGNTASITGIRGPAGYVYHNSVSITGTMPSGTGFTVNGINGHTQCFNNAVSIDLAGTFTSTATANGIVSGSNLDYNAIYSTHRAIAGYSTANAAALAGFNKNGTFGPINFDADLHITTGPSAAENIGKSRVLPLTDIDGDARDTSAAGKRDVGADEMLADLSTAWANDVMPLGLAYPGSSTPTGISVSPQVIVKNNTPTSVGSFSVTVTIVDALTSTTEFSATETVSGLNAMEVKTVSLAGSWAVTVVGTKNITVTTTLAGDVQTGNDVATASTSVSAPTPITTTKLYTFDASAENWAATTGPSATTDWKRKNSFAKLGGAYSGYSWVTERPAPTGTASQLTYTEGGYASSQGYSSTYPGANLLTSPWLDISGMSGSDVYISFVHSIRVEPDWDCAWMQYTVDGLNWKNLGTLNDPNGINWYNTALYKLAAANPDAFDDATAIRYGLIPDADHLPYRWATNDAGLLAGGDATGVEAGPDGWVYVQLKVNTGEIVHAPAIKFRYIGFSDAATASSPGGFGFDNFYIGNTAPPLSGGTITGTIFRDADGDGVQDLGEAGEASKDVKVYYYGVYVKTIQSDVNGVYTFNLADNSTLPGDYQLEPVIAGVAYTVPFGTSPKSTINHPSDGSAKTQNFGTFVGSVSGKVFEDVDNGGDKDAGEAGLGAFIVELHKDSANGYKMGFDTTDAAGLYSILAPPYANYVIKSVSKINTRISMPVPTGTYTVTVGTTSGDPSANLIDQDFGIFIFSQTKIEAFMDLNGDGIKGGADFYVINPGEGSVSWDVYKGAVKIATDVLGEGLASILHNFDAGDYTFTRVTPPPTNYIQTTVPVEFNISITTSRQNITLTSLYFKKTNLAGNVIEDLNGNGVAQAGEGPLAGWVISMTKGATTLLDTTDALGNYGFTNIENGPWTITQVMPSGWTRTFGLYAAAMPWSATWDPLNEGYNFGNFKDITVSGVLFRDRDNDGVKDAGEEGLSGWDVTLTGATGTTVPTGTNGEFSFTPAPRSAGYTLSFTLQAGYACTLPVGGTYAVAAVSGVNVTDQDFGVFKGSDLTKYRTFTLAQLSASTEAKPVKYKAGKAIVGPPNTANLIDRLVNPKVGGTYVLQVGKSGQLYPGGKEKAYLYVAKQGDAYKSFAGKGTHTAGTATGFDFTVKGGLMMKKWKTMTADKKNDELAMQLLALQINLAASLNGNTDDAKNLGALIYKGTGSWGTDQTIDQIADYADDVMTNWAGVPFTVYTDLLSAVSAINGAFASTEVGDTTTDGGWTAAKLKWATTKTVFEVPFLKSAVAPAKNRLNNDPIVTPEVYALGQNYPNPFNPSTTLSFDLPTDAIVTLKIFNVLGQEVATVLNRQEFSSGTEEVDFDASSLASGVYLYQIVAEEINADGTGQTFTQVKKMMLMK